jgi:hypothetical protein
MDLLAAVSGAAVNIHGKAFSFLLVVDSGLELPGPVVILCLTFSGTARPFSIMAVPLTFPAAWLRAPSWGWT